MADVWEGIPPELREKPELIWAGVPDDLHDKVILLVNAHEFFRDAFHASRGNWSADQRDESDAWRCRRAIELAAALRSLVSRLEEAERDRERLDWLEKHVGYREVSFMYSVGCDVRKEIDKARSTHV